MIKQDWKNGGAYYTRKKFFIDINAWVLDIPILVACIL